MHYLQILAKKQVTEKKIDEYEVLAHTFDCQDRVLVQQFYFWSWPTLLGLKECLNDETRSARDEGFNRKMHYDCF